MGDTGVATETLLPASPSPVKAKPQKLIIPTEEDSLNSIFDRLPINPAN